MTSRQCRDGNGLEHVLIEFLDGGGGPFMFALITEANKVPSAPRTEGSTVLQQSKRPC